MTFRYGTLNSIIFLCCCPVSHDNCFPLSLQNTCRRHGSPEMSTDPAVRKGLLTSTVSYIPVPVKIDYKYRSYDTRYKHRQRLGEGLWGGSGLDDKTRARGHIATGGRRCAGGVGASGMGSSLRNHISKDHSEHNNTNARGAHYSRRNQLLQER
mmetsp:Transcript_17405/g.40425  ORF Transcript_17405/g.40425 Transcript_17405/m.40425 type:complete len:154 (+) Transcript_17405:1479-1940(+)